MELLLPQIGSDQGFKFIINPGERAILLGPNGAGKSRLGAYIEHELSKFIVQNGAVNNSAGANSQNIQDQINEKHQELNAIESTPTESLKKIIENHQNLPFHLFIPNSLTRKDILRLYFNGEINNVSITFRSNIFIGSMPPASLDEISGGSIIIEGVEIDVDLMKTDSTSNESILNYKNGTILKIKRQIDDLKHNNIGFRKINKEDNHNENSILYCLRISGHRSLIFNQNISIKDPEIAKKNLHGETANINQKWNGKPIGGLQADFEALLVALISEEVNASLTFKQRSDSTVKPITKLDEVIKFWNKILPNRKITSIGREIKITSEDESYTLDQCSEGEKSIFYILGQCVIAPEKSLIIIDEPEIHINKSISAYLFDRIESARPDCAFIYITHDIDFSTSRSDSKFYILKNYVHPNKWNIFLANSCIDVPLEIITKISGSRKPILFCEGKDTSIDNLYRKIYPEFTVVPVGSFKNVIYLTNNLNEASIPDFHYFDYYGIIDGDNQNRATDKIKQIKVGLLENIFLIPEIACILYKIFHEQWPGEKEYIKIIVSLASLNDEWRKKISLTLHDIN